MYVMKQESLQRPDTDQQHAGSDERLANALETIDTVIPSSIEDAEFYAQGLNHLKELVDSENERFSEDLVEELHDKAAKGVDNWRLSTDERSHWSLVQGARTMKDVPAYLQSWAERTVPESATTKIAKLAYLKEEAGKRLKLDDELAEQDSDAMDVPTEAPTNEQSTASDEAIHDDLSDIVKFSKDGRARRENGKFISKSQLEQIEAHADQIREGMGKHERAIGLVELDSRGLAHRENGQIMSKEEIAELNAQGRKAWLKQQVTKDAPDEVLPTADELAKSREEFERINKTIREKNAAKANENESQRTFTQRIKAAPSAAKLALYGAVPQAGMALQKLREKLAAHDEQDKTKRNRLIKIGGFVVGGLMLGGIAYLASRGHDTSGVDHLAGGDANPDQFGLGTGAPDSLQGPVDTPPSIYPDDLKDSLTVDTSDAEIGNTQEPSTTEILQENATGNVENGHGLTHELIDLSAKAGYDLTPEQSYDLYKHLADTFGGDFFTEDITYVMGNGDYGISQPGSATWRPEVVEEIAEWLKNNA